MISCARLYRPAKHGDDRGRRGAGPLPPDTNYPGLEGEYDRMHQVTQVELVEDMRDVGLGRVLGGSSNSPTPSTSFRQSITDGRTMS